MNSNISPSVTSYAAPSSLFACFAPSIAEIGSYRDFAAWHKANYGQAYNTPSRDELIKEFTAAFPFNYKFDSEKDCFFYFMGQYATTPFKPGQRIDFYWRDVAARYQSMYQDFGKYGTD